MWKSKETELDPDSSFMYCGETLNDTVCRTSGEWTAEIGSSEDPGLSSDSSPIRQAGSNWMLSERFDSDAHKNVVKEKINFDIVYPDCPKMFGAVLLMKETASLALTGKLNVTVLWGAVDVFGSVMTSKHNSSQQLYSPISNSLLQIKALVIDELCLINIAHIQSLLVKNGNWKNDEVERVVEKIGEFPVGLLLQNIESRSIKHLEKWFPNLFLTNYRDRGIPCLSLPISGKCEIFDPATVHSINCEDWYNMLEDIETFYLQNLDSQPRIVICGGQNVGKSTMFRFLVNSLLNKFSEICCLDGDPGQCEFTPPGMISLTTISEPCLGSAYVNRKKSRRAIFIGKVTPEDHPVHYLYSIENLLREYKDNCSHMPLLINTMGWNKGLGLALVYDVIHLIQPTHVIQINSNAFHNRNFFNLSSEHLSKDNKSSYEFGSPRFLKLYKLITKTSPIVLGNKCNNIKLRKINLMSYMCGYQKSLGPWKPINCLPFQKIPWSSVALHIDGGGMKNVEDILKVFNASVVAMVKCNDSEMIDCKSPDLFKILRKMPICHCYGYGIVRGISMEEKSFYILSSLSLETLKEVNALIKGCIDIPLDLMKDQKVKCGFIPYLMVRKHTPALFNVGHKAIPSKSFKMKRK